MSGKRNVSVCSGHELANALYTYAPSVLPTSHFEKEVAKTLGIVQKDYHGKSFEGRQCPKLISKCDTLAALIPVDSLPIVNCLRLFEKVVEATFGHVLSSNYEEVLSQFGVSFTTILSTFRISMTLKIHILLHHIPQFLRMTQMPLGLFSQEVVEEQHKRFF